MKPLMIDVLSGLRSVANWVGLEGALLGVGTAALAAFAGYLHPAGALLVVGLISLALGFAVALRSR